MSQNTRIEGKTVKVKRQDIRIPLDFYNRLKQIAVEKFNAPIHHRSNEPAITPTLLKLAELGIEYLESGLADSNTDIIPNQLLDRLESLERKLNDSNPDTITTEIFKRLEALETKQPDTNTDTILNQIDGRLLVLEQSFKSLDSNLDKDLDNRIKTLERLADNNADAMTNQILERLESLERKQDDNNTDTIPKELADRLKRIEQQLAALNADTIPLRQEPSDNNTDSMPLEETEAAEQEKTYKTGIERSEDEDLTSSPQLPINTDNNDDINADKTIDFHSGVKEVLPPLNDSDPNSDEEKQSDETEESASNDEPLAPASTTKETGLTDSELAIKIGVNGSTVNRWRTGKSKPRGLNLQNLKNWEVRGDRWYSKPELKA